MQQLLIATTSIVYTRLLGLLLVGLLLFSGGASATWYSAEGKAEIINGDVEAARKAAVEDALRNALFQSGTTISGISELSEGVLQSEQFSLRAKGEVRNVQLMKERKQGDFFSVSLRADIQSLRECSQDYYLKSILVGPFSLRKRQQAQLGGIYRIDTELAKALHERLDRGSSHIDARSVLDTDIYVPNDYDSSKLSTVKQIASALADKYDVQFISYARINDISNFDADVPGLLDFGQKEKRRNFNVELILFDGVRGEIVLQKSYRGHEHWEMPNTQKVDVSGQVFWRSKYGQLVQQTINEMAEDVDKAIACRQSVGKITRVLNDAVIINLGRSNGLKLGDKFHLVHTRNYDQGQGEQHFLSFENGAELKVTALQSDRAIVTPEHVSDLGNVQIRDLLVPVETF